MLPRRREIQSSASEILRGVRAGSTRDEWLDDRRLDLIAVVDCRCAKLLACPSCRITYLEKHEDGDGE